MKIFDFIKKSFAARLSLELVSFAAVALLASNGFIGIYSLNAVEAEADRRAYDKLEVANVSIHGVMEGVERATYNGMFKVMRCLDDTLAISEVQSDMLEVNSEMSGCTLAFAPGYKGRKHFSVFTYRTDEGLKTVVQRDQYDYEKMVWFESPFLTGKSGWTDPYIDSHSSSGVLQEDRIITYMLPLKKDGRVIGVFIADVPVKRFSQLISNIKVSPNAATLMISDNGTLIVHPEADKLFTKIQESKDSATVHLGRMMLGNSKGKFQGETGGKSYYTYFKKILSTGWIVAVVYPESDIVGDYNKFARWINATIVVCLILFLLFCIWLVKRNVRPLTEFAKSAEQVALGNFSAPLTRLRRADEMGQLYRSFVHMQKSLVEYVAELRRTTAHEERMNGELHIARQIQMNMVPKKFPPYKGCEGVDIAAVLTPAREVGGDLYDFLVLDGKLYFTVGDVSGKGMPAALFMAVTRGLFRLLAHNGYEPSLLLAAINNTVSEGNDNNMFITMFVGKLDLETGKLTYCNAGHNPPLLVGPGGVVPLDVKRNVAVGVLHGYEYEQQEFDELGNSMLFVYTDGVTEAENANHVLFGEDELVKELRSCTGVLPNVVLKTVEAAVAAHVKDAKQSDDLTMMCIRKLQKGDHANKEWSLDMDNVVEEIRRLKEFVDGICADLSLSKETCDTLNLVLEEAVSNVILYAYEEGVSGPVIVGASYSAGVLEFEIEDLGKEFDPTAQEEADVSMSLEDRPIGGLGIFLIKNLMDSVSYARHDGKNVLRLTKRV